MNELFDVGLLGTGATIAARILGPGWVDAWLTNEPVIDGYRRWWEASGTGVWIPRLTEFGVGDRFPYGFTVDPP